MYPAKFDYYRAGSIDEAVALLQQHPDAKLLAGGHSLLPAMKLRLAQPEALIDIGRIPGLNSIESNGSGVTIGALVTHAQVEHSAALAGAPGEAAGWIGDPAVRNRGTVGGNIAHADPASDWPTLLVALDATIDIAGPGGRRSVAAADFFTGLFETALGENEVVTHIHIPSTAGSAYEKFSNPASRYAMVGCAAQLSVADDGTIAGAAVAIGGLVANARRCGSVEAALVGQPATEATLANAAQAVLDDLNPDDVFGDIHASGGYRRSVAPTIVKRALDRALARAI